MSCLPYQGPVTKAKVDVISAANEVHLDFSQVYTTDSDDKTSSEENVKNSLTLDP